MKTLHNSDSSNAKDNALDLRVFGNPDTWKLICKASSEKEGWMKSTKAMEIGDHCLIQVTTQQRNPDGSYAIAEALSFVLNSKIVTDENGVRRIDERIRYIGFDDK